jgi:hypothetical protein
VAIKPSARLENFGNPVSLCVSAISAPGTTFPLQSCTVPETCEPEVACASTFAASIKLSATMLKIFSNFFMKNLRNDGESKILSSSLLNRLMCNLVEQRNYDV